MDRQASRLDSVLSAVVLLIGCTGAALLAISFLPFEVARHRVMALSPHGSAHAFTPALFRGIAGRLQVVGCVAVLFAWLGYVKRHGLSATMDSVRASCRPFGADLRRYFSDLFRTTPTSHWVCVAVVMAFAVAVRVHYVAQAIQYDEAFTFTYYASRPLVVGLSYYTFPNNHLFHTFLVHVTSSIFGNHLWALRLPALVAGCLVVPATYLLGRMFHHRHVGLLASGVIAGAYTMIEYSSIARGYSLVCLCFVVLLMLGKYLLAHSGNRFAWALFVGLSAIGFYTIPVMLYPLGTVFLWILMSSWRLRRHLFLAGVATVLVTGMLYLPVVLVSGLESLIGNPYVRSRSVSFVLQQLPGSLQSTWNTWNKGVPWWASAVLVAGLMVSLSTHRHRAVHRVPLLLPALLWIPPVLFAQRVVPFERVWLFLLPLYAVAASAGIHLLVAHAVPGRILAKVRGMEVVSLAIMVLIGGNVLAMGRDCFSDQPGLFKNAEPVARFLKSTVRPGDRIVAEFPSDAALEYYLNRLGVAHGFLYADIKTCDRLLVVVNRQLTNCPAELTVEGVLSHPFLSPLDLSGMGTVFSYDRADVHSIPMDKNRQVATRW